MAPNIEEIIECAFEHAFSKALGQTLQKKAEELFRDAVEQSFQLVVENGTLWDRYKK